MSADWSDHLPAAMLTVAFGATIHGMIGFGSSLVWMSVFPLFTTVPNAVGILRPLAWGLNTVLLFQLWPHSNLVELKPLAVTAPLGIVFGLWIVTTLPTHIVNGLLGVFLLAYVVANTLRKDPQQQKQKECTDNDTQEDIDCEDEQKKKNKKNDLEDNTIGSNTKETINNTEYSRTTITDRSRMIALPIGFVGGCLASAFGTAGPAILVFARESGWESQPAKFRANLQIIFFSLNGLVICSLAISGIINIQTIRVSVLLVPPLVLGGHCGSKLASRVRTDVFRTLVLCGIAVMGTMYISKAVQEQQNLQK